MNAWLGRMNAAIAELQQSPGASRSQTLPATGVSPEAEARKKEQRAKKTKTMLPA